MVFWDSSARNTPQGVYVDAVGGEVVIVGEWSERERISQRYKIIYG